MFIRNKSQIEDLAEDIFFRRHQRYEMLEKRRYTNFVVVIFDKSADVKKTCRLCLLESLIPFVSPEPSISFVSPTRPSLAAGTTGSEVDAVGQWHEYAGSNLARLHASLRRWFARRQVRNLSSAQVFRVSRCATSITRSHKTKIGCRTSCNSGSFA